jgi:type IV pilus assembly protein PilO
MISATRLFIRLQAFRSEFEQIDLESLQTWPYWLRRLALLAAFVLVLGLLWLVWLAPLRAERQQADQRQSQLRSDFRAKLVRVAALPVLQERQHALRQRLQGLESQLLAAQDMQALLSDLSQFGRERQLTVELFRPAELQRQQPYGQQRITLRVTGRYADLLDFTADIAELPWLVSVASFTLAPAKEGALSMELQLRALRQVEPLGISTATPPPLKVIQ